MKRNRVQALLTKRGLKGVDVAAKLKIPPNRFYQIVNGHDRTPRIRKRVADFLDVEPRKLWPDYEGVLEYQK